MELRNKKRLLKELADASEDPKSFIYNVMALQKQSAFDVVKKSGMTSEHFYVIMSQIAKGQTVGVKTSVKIANGLGIEPSILWRIVSEHTLKCYLNKVEKESKNGINQNN